MRCWEQATGNEPAGLEGDRLQNHNAHPKRWTNGRQGSEVRSIWETKCPIVSRCSISWMIVPPHLMLHREDTRQTGDILESLYTEGQNLCPWGKQSKSLTGWQVDPVCLRLYNFSNEVLHPGKSFSPRKARIVSHLRLRCPLIPRMEGIRYEAII
jgi:hypothetical protein